MAPILAAGGIEIEEFFVNDDGEVIVIKDGKEEPFADLLPLSIPEENNPIIPETKEVIWGGIAFFLVFAVLARVAFPAIAQTMKDRSDKIQGDLEAAEAARNEAVAEKDRYEASLADAKAEAARIVDEAREQAEAMRAERMTALEAEVAERRSAAAAELEAQRANAVTDMRGTITEIALGAAEKVVGQSIDADANARIVDDYITQVGASS